jgi:hypothetical protein
MQVVYHLTRRNISRAQRQWFFSNCTENVRIVVTLHHSKSHLYIRCDLSYVPLRFTHIQTSVQPHYLKKSLED